MIFSILPFLSVFIACVYGSGELTVLHRPEGLLFKGHERLDESELQEVYSASMGLTIERSSSWSGLYITNPFQVAEAIVNVYVDGVSDLDGGKGHHYPLKTNGDDSATFDALRVRIEERNPSGSSKIVDINLSDGLDALQDYEFLHGIKHMKKTKGTYSYLKSNVEEDHRFLQEVNLLNAIADKIESGAVKKDSVPDYYRFRVLALHAVSDLHGENSTATKEAKQLLIEAINRLNEAFNKAYFGNVLVTVVTSDASHTRRIRSVPESKNTRADPPAHLNLAKTYSSNYPVIFNIILWFGVVMVFSLLAISMVIGSMDPGRDSIIYRMTSTRMKKDN